MIQNDIAYRISESDNNLHSQIYVEDMMETNLKSSKRGQCKQHMGLDNTCTTVYMHVVLRRFDSVY